MDPNSILALFGIDADLIEGEPMIDSSGGESFIYIRMKLVRPRRCPHCGAKEGIIVNDMKTVRVHHGYSEGKPVSLVVTKRRFRCKRCGRTFTEKTPHAGGRKRISTDAVALIADELKTPVTYKSIAKRNGVSIASVMGILDSMSAPGRLPMPRILCIDEFHFNVTDRIRYPAVITDFWTSRIVDVIKNRQLSYLKSYFGETSRKERENVRFFVSDLYETYRTVKQLYFPKAVHIADTFHVVALFTRTLQKIRTRCMKELDKNTYEYAFMKKNWKCFLMRRDRLRSAGCEICHRKTRETVTLLEMVDRCQELFPKLRTIYLLKEDFLRYTKGVSEREACAFIDSFVRRAVDDTDPDIATLGRTLKDWRQEIVNGLVRNEMGINITNAKAERNNGSVQKLISAANGLVNYARMRKRVLLIDRYSHEKGDD